MGKPDLYGVFFSLFSLLVDCAFIFLNVYFLALFSDLETDNINPIELCKQVNTFVLVEIISHGVLTALFLLTGSWAFLFLNLPLVAWNAYRCAFLLHFFSLSLCLFPHSLLTLFVCFFSPFFVFFFLQILQPPTFTRPHSNLSRSFQRDQDSLRQAGFLHAWILRVSLLHGASDYWQLNKTNQRTKKKKKKKKETEDRKKEKKKNKLTEKEMQTNKQTRFFSEIISHFFFFKSNSYFLFFFPAISSPFFAYTLSLFFFFLSFKSMLPNQNRLFPEYFHPLLGPPNNRLVPSPTNTFPSLLLER
jgi:ABC-type multidrug transport system fused ATPase/permease subunit